jgi:hypothetical protein
MELSDIIASFMDRVRDDPRISPAHVSLYMAVLHGWSIQGMREPAMFKAPWMMAAARIGGRGLFHRTIRQLHDYGYLRYEPSFKPSEPSRLWVLKNDFFHDQKHTTMSSVEFIPIHRQLVHFLSQFEAFKVDDGHEGQPLFRMRKKYVFGNFGEHFTVAQMNGAAEVLAVLLNLSSAAAGDLEVPKLLQAYFLDELKRKEINKLL